MRQDEKQRVEEIFKKRRLAAKGLKERSDGKPIDPRQMREAWTLTISGCRRNIRKTPRNAGRRSPSDPCRWPRASAEAASSRRERAAAHARAPLPRQAASGGVSLLRGIASQTVQR